MLANFRANRSHQRFQREKAYVSQRRVYLVSRICHIYSGQIYMEFSGNLIFPALGRIRIRMVDVRKRYAIYKCRYINIQSPVCIDITFV